jgi:hypothetical protein
MKLGPTKQNAVSTAISDCLSAMVRLKSVIASQAREAATNPAIKAICDDISASILAIEATAIDLIRNADTDTLSNDKQVMHAGSKAVLRALPLSHPMTFLDPDDVKTLLSFADPEYFILGMERGFLIGRGMPLLIDHKPRNQEWTDLLCERISPDEIFSSKDGLPIIYSEDIATIRNTRRLAEVLRAQVRHHPDNMSEYLSGCLAGRAAEPLAAVALYLAGARISPSDADIHPSKEFQSLADAMSSYHGGMKIMDEYKNLEDVLVRIANEHGDEPSMAEDWI